MGEALFEALFHPPPLALTLTGSMAVVDRLEGAYIPYSPYLVVVGTKSSQVLLFAFNGHSSIFLWI
jgi:hypothetical protein